MTPDALARMDDYFAVRADAPFGDTETISGRILQPFSVAGREAASNLLTKASRALDAGEADRARALVDRAVRLPYDRHEETHPAAFEVHLALFCLVTDELDSAPVGDSRWLDVAVAVLEASDEAGRCDLRDVLVELNHAYRLERRERGVLEAAIASVPERAELMDLALEPAELAGHVLSILEVIRRYRDATAALAG